MAVPKRRNPGCLVWDVWFGLLHITHAVFPLSFRRLSPGGLYQNDRRDLCLVGWQPDRTRADLGAAGFRGVFSARRRLPMARPLRQERGRAAGVLLPEVVAYGWPVTGMGCHMASLCWLSWWCLIPLVDVFLHEKFRFVGNCKLFVNWLFIHCTEVLWDEGIASYTI